MGSVATYCDTGDVCTPKPSPATDDAAAAAGTGALDLTWLIIVAIVILIGLVCFGLFFMLGRKGDDPVYKGPLASSDPDVERLVEIDAEMKALREKKKALDEGDEGDSIEESIGELETEQTEVLARIEAKELALKKIASKPKPAKKSDGEKEIAMVDLEGGDGQDAEKGPEKKGARKSKTKSAGQKKSSAGQKKKTKKKSVKASAGAKASSFQLPSSPEPKTQQI
jgi:FtsZ-interacting cell division protein ZipA